MLKFRIIDNQYGNKIAIVNSLPGLLIYSLLDFLNGQRVIRYFLMLLGALLVVAATLIKLVPGLRWAGLQSPGEVWLWGSIAGLILIILCILSGPRFTYILENDLAGAAVQDRINAEGIELRSPASNPQRSFDLDTKRITEYYAINQQQARNSFTFAVWAMIVGFATIIAGIWLYLGSESTGGNDTPSSLTTLAGIITNFVAILFIRVHNDCQKRSLDYFDQLVRSQQLALSIQLADSLEKDLQPSEKQKIISQILEIAKGSPAPTVASAKSSTDEKTA